MAADELAFPSLDVGAIGAPDPDQARRAARTVALACADPADRLAMLQALGLAPSTSAISGGMVTRNDLYRARKQLPRQTT